MEPTGNRLLDALPEQELAQVRPTLRREHLALGRVLFTANEPLEDAYFPIDAVVSLTLATEDGQAIEISMVGSEGVSGAWVALWDDALAPWSGVAQGEGDTWCCGIDDYRRHLAELPRLREIALSYQQMHTYLMSRSVLCNRYHELVERTARWLLIYRTRSTANPLPLTQEFLSQMLGSHRPSVTLALQSLAEAGLIRNEGRGQIRILDAERLQSVACECFVHVQEYERRVLDER